MKSLATEASKTNKLREPSLVRQFFSGRVLDIGAGTDPVIGHAEIFDQPQGDANKILRYLEPQSYDCVHSSHCLEHMDNPILALKDWWKLVKPGGYMITIVPHEDLYEQFNWPSIFNEDHKATFRLGGKESWSPVSIDLLAECEALPNSKIIEKKVWDQNFDYDLLFPKNTVPKNRRAFWNRQISSIARRIKNRELRKKIFLFQLSRGYPVDQTSKSDALAQIEVITKKIL